MATKKITFAETGITLFDSVERKKVVPGDIFTIRAVKIRDSKKYDEYTTFDGVDEEGNEVHLYTTSGVILSQAKEIVELYGIPDNRDGLLSAEILVAVESRPSENGRNFMLLV